MAETIKPLGQAALSATTLTDVYTVPSATSAIISSIFICNRGNTTVYYRLAIAILGAADTPAQYLAYDTPLNANDSISFTNGVTLQATDVIRAYASNGNVSVNIFGIQIT